MHLNKDRGISIERQELFPIVVACALKRVLFLVMFGVSIALLSRNCNINKALMINVKAQLMERDAIFVQLLANYLKCNAIELLR